jgi:hypothetical protein
MLEVEPVCFKFSKKFNLFFLALLVINYSWLLISILIFAMLVVIVIVIVTLRKNVLEADLIERLKFELQVWKRVEAINGDDELNGQVDVKQIGESSQDIQLQILSNKIENQGGGANEQIEVRSPVAFERVEEDIQGLQDLNTHGIKGRNGGANNSVAAAPDFLPGTGTGTDTGQNFSPGTGTDTGQNFSPGTGTGTGQNFSAGTGTGAGAGT